jgi:hypothetical protein
MILLARRRFVQSILAAPLAGWACARAPETPLAHLNGQAWVKGVYEMHAQRYLDVQMGAEASSHGAYRILAQKGVVSLDALQSREVPFYMRVDDATHAFTIERTVPERLTFTADMTDDDRQAATEAWKKAREHIHTDYAEIHRLNWAMTTLLEQLERIHAAMEQAEVEQFKIVRELAELRGGGATPYQLPDKVKREDYENVMLLLLVRLEDDHARLETIEASIAAVGLTTRATDAGSGSLAANIHKVLLSVIRDAEATAPKPAVYPDDDSSRGELLAAAKKLAAEIEASDAYVAWKKNEEAKAVEQVGLLFQAVDSITHLPTSAIFHAAVSIWKGDGDYLGSLHALAKLVPGGGQVAKTVGDAIETTEKVRRVVHKARAALRTVEQGNLAGAAQAAALDQAGGLLNTTTQFARSRLDKQLAFFTDKKELEDVKGALGTTDLVTKAMPAVPAMP